MAMQAMTATNNILLIVVSFNAIIGFLFFSICLAFFSVKLCHDGCNGCYRFLATASPLSVTSNADKNLIHKKIIQNPLEMPYHIFYLNLFCKNKEKINTKTFVAIFSKIAQMWYENTRFGRFSMEFRPNVWFLGYIWAILSHLGSSGFRWTKKNRSDCKSDRSGL